jgi:creatinine amidohydrolase/Fe(II)-dependent formamide hydrolase-like protein
MVRHLAPELVHMDRAEGYLYDTNPLIGYSFKGQDAIEAWITSDLAPTGAIGNPHLSSPEKGQILFDAAVSRLAELLEAIYRLPPRQVQLAPAPEPARAGVV